VTAKWGEIPHGSKFVLRTRAIEAENGKFHRKATKDRKEGSIQKTFSSGWQEERNVTVKVT